MNKFQHTTARIAAWNLNGFLKISDDRLKWQAEGLAFLDAEVVALVEINPFCAIETLRKELGQKGVSYATAILRQKSNLHIGVLFKEGIEVKTLQFIPGSDLNDPANRRALVVEMQIGQFDFVLIVVHLKSGRDKEEQCIRDRQAKVIEQFISSRLKQGREDILLVGDFNMIPGQDVSNFHHLGGKDVMDFISSWDLQDRFSHILPKGRSNLLDGFAITRTYSREYIRGSLRLFPMHWSMDMGLAHFKDTVSDHLPFVASFRIDRHGD